MVLGERKIQRLGGSSLIVTIPKHWARRNNIKPGDTVFLVEAGRELRVVPAKEGKTCFKPVIKIHLNKNVENIGVNDIIRCAYLHNYDELVFTHSASYPRVDAILDTISKSPYVEYIEKNYKEIRIAIRRDEDQEDPKRILRRLFVEFHQVIDLIREAQETGQVPERIKEHSKTMSSMIERYIVSVNYGCAQKPLKEGEKASRYSAATLISMIPPMLLGLAKTASHYKGDETASKILDYLFIAFREAVGSYLSESIKRAHNYRKMKQKIEKTIENLWKDPRYGALATRIEDMLVLLDTLTEKAICISTKNYEE